MALRYSDFDSYVSQRYSGYISMLCPFHEDRSPSLLVSENGWFECLACGVHGPWKWLWNKLHGQHIQIAPERRTTWDAPAIGQDSLEAVCGQAHEDLLHFPSLGWYLEMRGLQDRIEVNDLGYWEGWYTIPVYNRDYDFVTGVLRAAPHVQRVSGRRYWTHHQPVPYVPDWNLLERNNFLYVVYGMFDALALSELRLPVMTSTGGKDSFRPEWVENHRGMVYFIPDRGEEHTATKQAGLLGWRGKVLRLNYPDGYKDPADYFQAGRKSELLDAIGQVTA